MPVTPPTGRPSEEAALTEAALCEVAELHDETGSWTIRNHFHCSVKLDLWDIIFTLSCCIIVSFVNQIIVIMSLLLPQLRPLVDK